MAVAIVTGGSKGLGRSLAEALAKRGWSLVIDGRDSCNLETARSAIARRAEKSTEVVAVAGDVSNADHRAALVAAAHQLSGIDLVINNASVLGPSPLGPLRQYPLEALRDVYEVNVLAPLALFQLALPLLAAAPNPRLINVSSDAAVEAYEGWGGYGSSKAALDQLSAVLASEEPSVRVWSLDPGDMRTDMHQAAFPGEDISDRPLPEAVVPQIISLIESALPSGRYRAAELDPAMGD